MIATIESIIDAYQIKYGQPTDPSQQELLDCVSAVLKTKYPLYILNLPCYQQQAFPSQYFDWIVQNGGIDTESSYPYTGNPGPCKPTNQYAAQLSGYTTIEVTPPNSPSLAASLCLLQHTNYISYIRMVTRQN